MSEVVQYVKNAGHAVLPYWPLAAVPIGIVGVSKLFSWLIPGAHNNPKFDLRNKTVLITGASSGLGKALAFEFYKRGAKVIITARSIQKLIEICAELESAKVEFGWKNQHEPAYRYLDLSELGDETSARQQIDDLKTLAIDGKTIDVLVNNAGMSMRGGCVETPIKIQRQLMDVNFFGHVLITKLLYDSIPDDGAIVVTSSLQGKVALPYRSAYSASKHALQAFFDSLRAEGRPKLQILVVSAGYINTGFGSRALDAEGRQMGREDENQQQGMSSESAASTIVNALIRRETELIMAPFKHRLAITLRYFTPKLLNWFLYKRGQTDTHLKAN
ncbi:hypothetical protein FO519_000797 [Halicephalobus sp. NKZ332]|nr:hypothetical protein FO519_000797 [Halicephalobus sp. NKZ332]